MSKLRKTVSRVGADIREYYWAGIIFLGYFAAAHFLFGVLCPQLVVTGIPCPGCGLTRAFFSLARGQAGQAALANPSVFPVLAFLLYCGFYRYGKGEKAPKMGAALALLVICMLAVYGHGMYLHFPEHAPYIYFRDNLLARLVPGYGAWVESAWGWLGLGRPTA